MDNNLKRDTFLTQTVDILKEQNVQEITLFGSSSANTFSNNSDIDLLVILDIDKVPETFEEKMRMKLQLRKSIRHINRQIAIDLLVYTKKEYEIIKKERPALFNDIWNKGMLIYEKAG